MSFGAIRRSLEAEVQGLDPALYAPSDAVKVLEELERIERLASAAKALVAPRAAESGQWSREGHVTPEHWLAKKTGSTVRSAKDTLATGEKVKQLPKVEAALRKGQLSAAQAATVADAAAADPSMQDKLLDTAQGDSLAALRDTAERVKAASRRDDPEAEHARIHRQRSLVTYRERDGATTLKATGPRDAMATVKANLEPFIRAAFEAARLEGRREPSEAYAFDGLVAMAQAAGSPSDDSAPKAKGGVKLIARVDYGALWRGWVEGDEVCEIDGVGPVPVSVVEKLAEDAFVAVVLTDGVDVMRVAHFGRKATAFQTTALQWRDRHCVIEGCTNARTQVDHHVDWANSKRTFLPDLGGLRAFHHKLKTYKGYRLVDSSLPGRKRLIAPDEPDPPPPKRPDRVAA